MSLEFTSFVFTAIGVIVAVLTFVFGDDLPKNVRLSIGAICGIVIIVFGLVGIFATFRDVDSSTTVLQQNPTQVSVPTSPTIPNYVQDLGVWYYQGNRPALPSSPGVGQIIFANGDIANSGTCYVKRFEAGEPVQGLGNGTFQLWLISGSAEYINQQTANIQSGAARDAGMDCPYLD